MEELNAGYDRGWGDPMQPLLFACGAFVFVGLCLIILRYTTHLSNIKKHDHK